MNALILYCDTPANAPHRTFPKRDIDYREDPNPSPHVEENSMGVIGFLAWLIANTPLPVLIGVIVMAGIFHSHHNKETPVEQKILQITKGLTIKAGGVRHQDSLNIRKNLWQLWKTGFVRFDEDNNILPSEKRENELKKFKDKVNNSQVYKLTAAVGGNFPCSTCPDAHIYLNKDEIYKIGVTKDPNERYSFNQLAAQGLNYITIYNGTYGDCLIKEKELLICYPSLPENLRRETILILPPGNAKKQ